MTTRNEHFSAFLNDYVEMIIKGTRTKENPKGLTKTEIYYASTLTRQIIYRWQQKGVFPKPINLHTFFVHTLDLLNIGIEDPNEQFEITYEIMQGYMSQAYQALLLDFYERQKYEFC